MYFMIFFWGDWLSISHPQLHWVFFEDRVVERLAVLFQLPFFFGAHPAAKGRGVQFQKVRGHQHMTFVSCLCHRDFTKQPNKWKQFFPFDLDENLILRRKCQYIDCPSAVPIHKHLTTLHLKPQDFQLHNFSSCKCICGVCNGWWPSFTAA